MNLVEENAEPTGVHDILADLGKYKNMYVNGTISHCKSLVLTFHLNVLDIYLMYTNLHLVDNFFHLFSLFV